MLQLISLRSTASRETQRYARLVSSAQTTRATPQLQAYQRASMAMAIACGFAFVSAIRPADAAEELDETWGTIVKIEPAQDSMKLTLRYTDPNDASSPETTDQVFLVPSTVQINGAHSIGDLKPGDMVQVWFESDGHTTPIARRILEGADEK